MHSRNVIEINRKGCGGELMVHKIVKSMFTLCLVVWGCIGLHTCTDVYGGADDSERDESGSSVFNGGRFRGDFF